jgi:hypothetical protein
LGFARTLTAELRSEEPRVNVINPDPIYVTSETKCETPGSRMPMTFAKITKAIFTDIHFLIPLAVLCIGVTLLVTLY